MALLIALAACGSSPSDGTGASPATSAPAAGGAATSGQPVANGGPTTLVLGAYTTPREAYGKLIPLFKDQWKQKTGQDITVQESYQGSGAQSRAIVEGFEADTGGLRSIDPEVAKATAQRYPAIEDQFKIDYFGGWGEATPKYFGDDGVYTKAIAAVQQ
jgi:ABC-type sulfate transport system substrate-binding protein